MVDLASPRNCLQVRKDWEDLVPQARRDNLLLWGALFLRRRSLLDGSATGLLFIRRQGGIGPPQICAEEVKLSSLKCQTEAPN